MARSKFALPISFPKISRTIQDPEARRLIRSHAHQIGEVVNAWTDLQTGCFMVFQAVLEAQGLQNLNIVHALWHSAQSDSAQREMLLAVARSAFHPKERVFAQIKWLRDKAERMAPLRNDPAHTPVSFSFPAPGAPSLVPNSFVARDPAVKRLRENPLNKSWERIRGDFLVLSIFAFAISLAIRNPHSVSLPCRPRILSFPASKIEKVKDIACAENRDPRFHHLVRNLYLMG